MNGRLLAKFVGGRELPDLVRWLKKGDLVGPQDKRWTSLALVKTYPLDSRVVILYGVWRGIRGRVCVIDGEKQLVTVEFTTVTGKTLARRPFKPDQIQPLSVVEMIGELSGE